MVFVCTYNVFRGRPLGRKLFDFYNNFMANNDSNLFWNIDAISKNDKTKSNWGSSAMEVDHFQENRGTTLIFSKTFKVKIRIL